MREKLLLLVSTLLIVGPALTSTIRAELVGWWKLDDGSGTIAQDSSVNGNHGTLQGDPEWTDGQIDGGLTLDGDGDYVELPIGSVIASLSDSTIALWVNYSGEGGGWQRIFDFGTGTTNYIYLCPSDGIDGSMHAAITAGQDLWTDLVVTTGALPTGWHHVALVIDGTAKNMKIVLDGEIVADASTLYVLQDLGNTTLNWLGRSQYADPYFNGTLDDLRIYDQAMSPAAIQKIMRGDVATSLDPSPADKATDVPRDTVLGWTPGEFADTHNVYFGTVFDDINAADTTNPLDVLVGQSQDANTYDPTERLELGQTYYWRVDEVNAPPDYTVFRGDVWSFTIEPYARPIENITATASSSNNANMGPEKTIDGSGLNDADGHSTETEDMWLSAKTGPQPTWIQYAFDKSYKLNEMLIWNSNQALESMFGLGAKDVTVEYSLDGDSWTTFGDLEFPQATGEDTYTPATIGLGNIMAKYVKLTINSNWGDIFVQYGLSEVRFLAIPVSAREPKPADGETGVDPQLPLSWRPGREADSHKVYLSTEEQAVIDGTALEETVSQPSYGAALDLSKTYYWKVVEVNEAEDPPAWESDIWSFSTNDYVVVDDFESYTDDYEAGEAIWQAWSDGLEDPQNGGSQVGYNEAPFAEQTIVHTGRQSMPLAYDNSTGTFSQAVRTFDAPQDWTRHGITALVLFFHGRLDNAPAPLYVKINNTKVPYNGSAATTMSLWKQWTIDLASLGVNLQSINSITIGVGNGASSGMGTLYIDDIRLYGTPPEVVAPADPGSDGLVIQYSMEGNLQDGSGNGNDGTPMGDPTYADGPAGYGQVLNMDGTNDYVDLPIGSLIGTWRDVTIAVRVNQTDVSRLWQRVFDIGTGATVYMFLTPNNSFTGTVRFAITTAGGGANESLVTAPAPLSPGWHHLAVTIDIAAETIQLYVDGDMVASAPTTTLPADLGATTQNWLGRSQYEADPYFMGMLDEFRIYNRALSTSEVRYLAGDR